MIVMVIVILMITIIVMTTITVMTSIDRRSTVAAEKFIALHPAQCNESGSKDTDMVRNVTAMCV